MTDEAVVRMAFWLFKRGLPGSRNTLEVWTWLPASAKRQYLDEAREALTHALSEPEPS